MEAIQLLGVERVDHGVRCLEDEKLVEYLQQQQIPLTVFPLSNIKLRVFESMKDHNLKTMLEKGLKVTVHSDDPAYFGGYVNDNYRAVQKSLSLADSDIYQLIRNSFDASFLDDQQKAHYLSQLDQALQELKT